MTSQKRNYDAWVWGVGASLGLTGCINVNFDKSTNKTIWGLAYIILVIYALIQVLDSRMSSGTKLLWVLAIIFFPFIGSVAWFVFGRR